MWYPKTTHNLEMIKMKQAIAAVLVLASGSSVAGGLSQGNVDLDGWVVEHQPAAATTKVDAHGGILSRGNVDLFGWVVENRPADGSAVAVKESGHVFGRGNVDLDQWVVSDAVEE